MPHAWTSCKPSLLFAQARGPRSGEADLTQPWLEASQPCPPDMQPQKAHEDTVMACDATIAAIGIVAVLIVNVAYVGAPGNLVSFAAHRHVFAEITRISWVMQWDEQSNVE